MAKSSKRLCLYCGNPFKKSRKGKGEHLVPVAIGGTLTTKDVCIKCNNTTLSELDTELCSLSPLSVVAARAIDGYVSQTWDYDERTRILLEGSPKIDPGSFGLYPQVIITPNGEQFWAQQDELIEFGADLFHTLFCRRLRKALWEYEHGIKSAIWFTKHSFNDGLHADYHYPPRFFVRGTVSEACTSKTIELSFLSKAARRLALHAIDNGLNVKRIQRSDIDLGSLSPTLRFSFDGGKVWRAMAKIGVNLLHHYCGKTVVDCTTFPRVIGEILGHIPIEPSRMDKSGFVYWKDVESIAADDDTHTFRLSWERGWWNVAMAFFGGRIGAAVKFPGPNNDDWDTLDVHAPIHSREWTARKSKLVIPSQPRVEWLDLNKIIRGGDFVNNNFEKTVELSSSNDISTWRVAHGAWEY